jgi:hypothetical protein
MRTNMSPSGARYIDINYSLEYAVTRREDIQPLLDDFKERYEYDIDDVAHTIFTDRYGSFEVFKKAWYDPNYRLTKLDEILIGKFLESEPGRS